MFDYAFTAGRPAILASLVAFAITLAFACIVIFWLFPPMGAAIYGPIPIDFSLFGEVLWQALAGSRCSGLAEKLIGIDCHLAPLADLVHLMGSTRDARLATTFVAGAVLFAGIFAFIDALIHTPLAETAQTTSGRSITYGEQARREIRQFIASHGGEAVGLWLFPHVRLTRKQETRNILLLGGHGSGKTAWLRGLIEQLLGRRGKTFILDVKGDMVEGLPDDDFVLVSAADARSWAWNVAADIRTRLHAVEFASKIIAAAERDPMWTDAARAILADLIVYLQKQPKQPWGWPELARIALSTPAEIKAALVSIKAPSAVLITFNSDDEESRTVLSILTTLWVAALTQLVPLAEAWQDVPVDRRFSIRDWVRND
ncbi:type IV secretion system DNA-binding domain-containing protein, partial [Bosea sp. TAB14]|uniref:type IV secretion system DNA-binding domain-containing protein n=1 Tax=Bosea sp. TAB14 TaxID=3237481 RepID=UPI003F91C287